MQGAPAPYNGGYAGGYGGAHGGYQQGYQQYPQYGPPGQGYGQGPYGGQGYAGYNAPYQGYQGGFDGYGRGAGFGRGGSFGRGRGGFPAGFRGGMHPPLRRKKPFVGGSLQTQREWERSSLCCFYLQANCNFGDQCRFSHEDDGKRKCHFGLSCRVGHQNRGTEQKDAPAQKDQNAAAAAPATPAPAQATPAAQPAATTTA
jgi:hypothetical protein